MNTVKPYDSRESVWSCGELAKLLIIKQETPDMAKGLAEKKAPIGERPAVPSFCSVHHFTSLFSLFDSGTCLSFPRIMILKQ